MVLCLLAALISVSAVLADGPAKLTLSLWDEEQLPTVQENVVQYTENHISLHGCLLIQRARRMR